ncbi:MAG: hypothetical protein ACI4RA_09545 [Kiritimatiellia bacterium]
MKLRLVLLSALAAAAAHAQYLEYLHPAEVKPREAAVRDSGELRVSGDYMSANRNTGELLATGHVTAVSRPYSFRSQRVARTADGIYSFGADAFATTCTNDVEDLHWGLKGDFTYIQDQAILAKDVWLYHWGLPVAWLPIWYQPLNTDYGLRVVPGYRSRWGGFVLTKYNYSLIEDREPHTFYLGASTYADYRTKNGFALGQTLRWGQKESTGSDGGADLSREGLGRGKVKVYNAWDEDYDRYMRRNWSSHHRNYQNWGSDVERRRYRVTFEHTADFTERDTFNAQATYFSDSHMNRDFFEKNDRLESIPVNDVWYEHRELSWAAGATVSGPVNDFYGGTARLPEGWFAVEPQPIWDLPVNYESQTRAGYLNHDYARYGSSDPMFRYVPYIGANGRGADYQAFRMDTAHRVTIPFKLWDVLSVVPRAGYRGTYWSDSGDLDAAYLKASGDGVFRHICEIGLTLSARGSGWYGNWRHTVEPYLDYSYQAVDLSEGRGNRYYAFDSYDRSIDWLDQFGFEGRGLPYNWHGIRPGIRNTFQEMDDKGILRTILDWDVYAAVPFETMMPYGRGTLLAGYPDNDEDGNYNRSGRHQVVPGTRIRWNPSRDISFLARAEYDCQNSKAAYSDIIFRQRLAETFSYNIGYIGRDQRLWTYLPSAYDRWNYEHSNILQLGFTHDVCDVFAWSPYIRHDCRRDEVDEVGAWFDLLTDCLGYRIMCAHETAYRRVDGSKERCDNRICFFIYLRAFGPGSMLDLARF